MHADLNFHPLWCACARARTGRSQAHADSSGDWQARGARPLWGKAHYVAIEAGAAAISVRCSVLEAPGTLLDSWMQVKKSRCADNGQEQCHNNPQTTF